jgi:hypothetical protein
MVFLEPLMPLLPGSQVERDESRHGGRSHCQHCKIANIADIEGNGVIPTFEKPEAFPMLAILAMLAMLAMPVRIPGRW